MIFNITPCLNLLLLLFYKMFKYTNCIKYIIQYFSIIANIPPEIIGAIELTEGFEPP